MQCPRCHAENPQHAKFCLECGTSQALACSKCRAELPGSAKFCLECGEPVAQQVRNGFTSPESYTPKHLAEKILTSKAALEGERKQVTVLFADLKGSMELLADETPRSSSFAARSTRPGKGAVRWLLSWVRRVGKSRLTFELTHSHRVEGWLVLEAGASSHGKATSYLPVTTLLRSYFTLGERDTYEDMRATIRARLSALGEGLWPAAPAFEALLDVPVEDARWQGLEPRQRRQHTLEAVGHLLLRESQIQPLLLVVEDLHWIDAETQAWLNGQRSRAQQGGHSRRAATISS